MDSAEVVEQPRAADVVFEQLREEILALKLLPGTKLSEIEMARRFDVSRQPVRDAFTRLEALELLLVRPKRATEVRGFSASRISEARFVRLAVELEVVRRACQNWDRVSEKVLQRNLEDQHMAVEDGDLELFHRLDFDYHELVCKMADCRPAFETIAECKHKVDRLCLLSLTKTDVTKSLVGDHKALFNAMRQGKAATADAITRKHLARLDETIKEVQGSHAHFFE